jgi:hypothetical protein
MALDIHLLVHHLRRPARTSKPRQRPSPIRVRVCLGHQDQFVIKRTLRTHPNKWFDKDASESEFDDPHMDGKII